MVNEYGDKLLKFKSRYDSPEFKMLPVDQKKNEIDTFFEENYGKAIRGNVSNPNEAGQIYSNIRGAFDGHFPVVAEPIEQDLSRKARVGLGNLGQGATELFSGAAGLGRSAVNTVGHALGQEQDILPQPEQSIGEKFKEQLGVTEAEEKREPGLAIGGRIVGNLITPLPILKATKAAGQGMKFALEGATPATGKTLQGVENVTTGINEAGQVTRELGKTQSLTDVIQSAINPAVNPHTLNQFLIQGVVYTGVNTVGNKLRTGDSNPEEVAKDIAVGVLTSLPVWLGAKALSHVLENAVNKAETKALEDIKNGIKDKSNLTPQETSATKELLNKINKASDKKSTGSVGHGQAAGDMAHVLEDDLDRLNTISRMSNQELKEAFKEVQEIKTRIKTEQKLNKDLDFIKQNRNKPTNPLMVDEKKIIDAFKLDDMSGEIKNIRGRQPFGDPLQVKSDELLEGEISPHLGQPNLPIQDTEASLPLLNPKRLQRSTDSALKQKFLQINNENIVNASTKRTAELMNQFNPEDIRTNGIEVNPRNFLDEKVETSLYNLLMDETGSLQGPLDPFNIAQKGIELAKSATRSWDELFKGIRNNVEKPLSALERVGGFENTINMVKSAVIDSKRFTGEVLRPHMDALAEMNLRPSEYRQIAQMLDTTDIDSILAMQSSDPIVTKAKLVANFFKEAAEAAGLPPEKRLSAYFPHIQKNDPQGWSIIEKQFKSGSPFFTKEREAGSTLDNVNIYDVMEAYGAGVRRKIIQNIESDLMKTKGSLKPGHAAEPAFTVLLNNIRRIRDGNGFETLNKNFVENSLRFNLSSSLLNSTQTFQTLLPEIGQQTFRDSIEALKDPQVVKFLKKLALEDDVFSRYEIFDDIGDQRYTKQISELAGRKDIVKFLENVDLFKNIEVRNRMMAATAGLVRQAGGKDALLQKLKAGLSRQEEQELLMAADDLIQKTQFTTDFVNRSNLESNATSKLLLTFMNYPLREAGLVGSWIKERNLAALTYYHGMKIALAGKAGARVLIPAGLEAIIKDLPLWKDYYENFQDSMDFLDTANIPKYLNLDMSQSVGLLDPTDLNLYQMEKFPLPKALSKIGSSVKELLEIGNKDVILTEQEKLLSPQEQMKIQQGETGKRVVKSIANIAKFFPAGKGIPIGDKNFQIGSGQIAETIEGGLNAASGRNTVAGIPQETNIGNEFARQFAPTRQDVARLTARESAKRALSYIESGNRPDKSTMKNLEDAGFSKDEVNVQAKRKLKDKWIDKLIAGDENEKAKAMEILSRVMSPTEIQYSIVKKMRVKYPSLYKQFKAQQDSDYIEGNLE